jgi:hypothetical protein
LAIASAAVEARLGPDGELTPWACQKFGQVQLASRQRRFITVREVVGSISRSAARGTVQVQRSFATTVAVA